MKFATFASALVLMFSAAQAIEIEAQPVHVADRVAKLNANNQSVSHAGRSYKSLVPRGEDGELTTGDNGYVEDMADMLNSGHNLNHEYIPVVKPGKNLTAAGAQNYPQAKNTTNAVKKQMENGFVKQQVKALGGAAQVDADPSDGQGDPGYVAERVAALGGGKKNTVRPAPPAKKKKRELHQGQEGFVAQEVAKRGGSAAAQVDADPSDGQGDPGYVAERVAALGGGKKNTVRPAPPAKKKKRELHQGQEGFVAQEVARREGSAAAQVDTDQLEQGQTGFVDQQTAALGGGKKKKAAKPAGAQ